MDNPGAGTAAAAPADSSAAEPMQVENPSPPNATAGNGKEGSDTDMSPVKPTSMDIDSLSTGQTAGKVSDANALVTASSNTSASAPPSAPASAAPPTTSIGTTSSNNPSATITYTHACFLCCRKFTSLEQLLKHNAKSKLHKTNLEREKALIKEKEESEPEPEPESESESEKKSDAGQDTKGDDSSDGSDRGDDGDEDEDEDDESGTDSERADAVNTARSSKRKRRSSKKPSKPRRSRSRVEGPVQVWRCSSCNDAYFDTYEEAFEHEARCARRARRESSMADSSSDSDTCVDDMELGNERTKQRAVARAEAKEKEALEQKKWKEEDDQLKGKGIELGGKGVPFNLTAEDKKILSDYNCFLFENVEMFAVDQEFNDQLAASGTGSGRRRAQGTVGLRCVHCKYRPYGERTASSCAFPGRLSIFSTHLHQIVSTHFLHCLSLPEDFHEQVKRHKDKLPVQSYLNGFLGINAFMEKYGADRWNLLQSRHGLQFAGTELVQSDSDSDNKTTNDVKNQKSGKSNSNSNVSSSLATDGEEPLTLPGRKRGSDNIGTSSEKPKKKRGRPRLSDKEKQRREMERKTGSCRRKEREKEKKKRKKKKKKKKRKEKTPEDLLLESIKEQVPFGLSKSDPLQGFSPLHKLLREATEVFVIRTKYEAIDLTPFGDPLLKIGYCGLRCKFCQDHCVFPAHVEDIYNKVRRGIQDHISSGECDAMTPSLKRRYFAVENETRSPNISTLYREQAKKVGLYDIGEREGLGLRGVSTALINANIEGSDSDSSSNSNSDSDGDEMSTSSSSSSSEDESDIESEKNQVGIINNSSKKLPVSARSAAEVCKHHGCDKYKQARCEGFCIRHYRESQALFDSDSSRDKKGPKLCSVSGCTKNSRSDGNGMCRHHHSESLKRKKSKQDKSSTGTTDRPKEAKGSRMCSVSGCTKQSQYKCNGMCYRHHSASKKQSNEADRESDANSSDDSSPSSSESDAEHPVVSDLMLRDERSSISPYRLKLLSSLQLCYLSPKDAARNHKRKDFPLGTPGVRCKYCHKLKVFGIADTLWFNVSKGKQKSHLDECSGIHYKQKLHLDRLEREEDESDRSMFSAAVPKSLRAKIYKRMVERATSEKYLSKKAGKKLLETAKERDSSRKKA